MKRGALKTLAAIALLTGAVSVGAVATFASFQTKRQLDRFTTIKNVVKFEATGDSSWWNTHDAKQVKTAIWIFLNGNPGQWANNGAFMDCDGAGHYTASLPPTKDGTGATVYDRLIFVRCSNSADSASWDAKIAATDDASQTVDIPYTGEYTTFTLWHDSTSAPVPGGKDGTGSGTGGRRGGAWSGSDATYTYNASSGS